MEWPLLRIYCTQTHGMHWQWKTYTPVQSSVTMSDILLVFDLKKHTATGLPHLVFPPDGQCCHSPAVLIADRRSVRPSPGEVKANCAHKKELKPTAADKSIGVT